MVLTIGEELVKFFKDPILAICKDVKEEFLQIFNSGLTDYIDNYYDKFSKTKTFIYRDDRINFYDIFYPVSIKNSTSKITEIKDLKDLFQKKKFITIIGNAGSGKSMLMKHIFLSTVKQYYSIPIFVELRNLNDFNGTLEEYILKVLSKNKLSMSQKITEKILSEGNFIFLLDGYDEIFSNTKEKITRDIEDFVDLYNKNTFVITSRPGSNAESLQRFDNFYVENLSDKQIKEFINLQYKNHDNKESIGKIISVIEKNENKDYKDYLSNPLLLSMFIFTFNNYPELPKNKSKFYWNVFETLCTRHDTFTKKGAWQHERKSKLQSEEFEKILKWFSFTSLFNGKYSFDSEFLKSSLSKIKSNLGLEVDVDNLVYDLHVSLSILILDGVNYTFPHKSLQEYFAALLIKELNEDQKKEVYEKKFAELKSNTTGGNLNFFRLCFENDKVSFSKYVILPNAKKLITSIDRTSEISLAKTYLEFFGLTITFLYNDSGQFQPAAYHTNLFANEFFIPFISDKSFIPHWNELGSDSALKSLVSEFKKVKTHNLDDDKTLLHYQLNLKAPWQDFMLAYIIESKIISTLVDFDRDITSGYKELESEINMISSNTNFLLGI